MAKSISLNAVIEKNKVSTGVAFIMLLQIDLLNTDTGLVTETVFLANNNENITSNLNVYEALPFDYTITEEAGVGAEMSVSITDLNKIILSKINSLGGATGSEVVVRMVRSTALDDYEIEETFEVNEVSAGDFSITLGLTGPNLLRRQFPRSTQIRDRCRWRFKSAECGYVGGASTCDLSLQGANGCAAKNNTQNFGGFPALSPRGS